MFFFTLLLFSPAGVLSQNNSQPFADGERLTYWVSYNWEFVWVDAGKVEFAARSQWNDGKRLWYFKSSGRSFTAYDMIYRVRDYFESLADFDTFEPLWYRRETLEGEYFANNQLDFHARDSIIISQTQNSHKALSVDTIPFSEGVFDLQTAVYYARTFNFDAMQAGQEIPLKVIVDGQVYDLSGSYQGQGNVELRDGRIYRCHHFTVELVAGTIFAPGQRASIWVSADKNRVPLLIEAQILLGSVKAFLTRAENLRHPETALIP